MIILFGIIHLLLFVCRGKESGGQSIFGELETERIAFMIILKCLDLCAHLSHYNHCSSLFPTADFLLSNLITFKCDAVAVIVFIRSSNFLIVELCCVIVFFF